MKILFPALDTRFKSDSALVKLSRKLYRGYEGEPITGRKPITEVSGSLTDTLDGFDKDVEVYDITFTFFSDSLKPDACDDWQERMIDIFDDANLSSNDFSTAGCERVGKKEPFIEDGVFRASMDYRITIERAVKIPATRYA